MNMPCRFVWAGLVTMIALDAAASAQEKIVAPAANVRVRVRGHEGPVAALLDPSAPAWKEAVPTRILLSRTPRIYQTETPFTGVPPACEVRARRAGDRLVLRLEWTDATRNAPPASKTESHKETGAFFDAAAVMVPAQWSGGSFPSLVMGDKHAPVRLFYWNAGRGAEELTATGRATPMPTGKRFEHRAVHAGERWLLTMELPAFPDNYPIAFALWDGATGDRDGLKFFSIWYVLVPETPS